MGKIDAKRDFIEKYAKEKSIDIDSADQIKNLGIPEVDQLIDLLRRAYSG